LKEIGNEKRSERIDDKNDYIREREESNVLKGINNIMQHNSLKCIHAAEIYDLWKAASYEALEGRT
jgi:hypothetical protein